MQTAIASSAAGVGRGSERQRRSRREERQIDQWKSEIARQIDQWKSEIAAWYWSPSSKVGRVSWVKTQHRKAAEGRTTHRAYSLQKVAKLNIEKNKKTHRRSYARATCTDCGRQEEDKETESLLSTVPPDIGTIGECAVGACTVADCDCQQSVQVARGRQDEDCTVGEFTVGSGRQGEELSWLEIVSEYSTQSFAD